MKKELREPTDERLFAIVEAIKLGMSVDQIQRLSHIDKWFLYKIVRVVEIERRLCQYASGEIPADVLLEAKQSGFSDRQIAVIKQQTENEVREYRRKMGIRPFVRQIDTLGAEYPAQTNYLYLSYNSSEDDITVENNLPAGQAGNSVIILGSGAYRIGSSVEFDWCCVNAGHTLRELGYHTVMLNYNPETVSTDYDEFDQLFFEEISLETILEIYEKLSPIGIVVSMGGQVPNNLALKLNREGVKILGTSPENIDRAENRHKFSSLMDELHIDQPVWEEVISVEEALAFAQKVGYPVLVRPSYVLSGAAMAVASNDSELSKYLQRAVKISPEYPTVISKFLENAKEIEMDAIAKDGNIFVYAISEHVENAGVHSGDATLVLPAQRTYLETIRRIRSISRKIAAALEINGPFNIQFIAIHNEVKVIECNLRASRSFPFVSKILKQNFIDLAVKLMMDHPVDLRSRREKIDRSVFEFNYVGVKAPHFSFTRLDGADPTLSVEMSSTGEVACLGKDFDEAFLKALISVGYDLNIRSILLSTGSIESKAELLESIRMFCNLGIRIYATRGTAKFLNANGIDATVLNWPLQKKAPNTTDYIKEGKIDLVVNIPKNYRKEELTNDYIIRRLAVDHGVPLITNRQIAMRLAEALTRKKLEDLQVRSWEEY